MFASLTDREFLISISNPHVMKGFLQKLLILSALLAPPASALSTRVTFYLLDSKYGSSSVECKATGEVIRPEVQDGGSGVVELEPGEYTFRQIVSGSDPDNTASIDFTVKDPEEYADYDPATGLKMTVCKLVAYISNSEVIDGSRVYWEINKDYTIDNLRVVDPEGNEHAFTQAAYRSTDDALTNGICMIGFMGYSGFADIRPTELHPDYIALDYEAQFSSSTSSSVAINQGKTLTLTFPADAEGEISYKRNKTHYLPFVYVQPVDETTVDGMTTKTYILPNVSSEYCYRVSRQGSLTHSGLFAPNKYDQITVSEEDLSAHSNRYFDHEIAGKGTNYSDIFLNINSRNLLRMKAGEQFQIVNLRTWQLTDTSTTNYFIEPDYSWTVLNTDFQPDESVVAVDDNGMLTAKASGTAIVQVRYDAINLEAMNGSLWSEIWAENTGTFVVTVDADESMAPADNIRLAYKPDVDVDAEHDIMYYMADQPGYRLTFTPAEGSKVEVANPLVDNIGNNVSYPDGFSDKNVSVEADGTVTVLLTFGRNIIRVTDAEGHSNYQVLSAKPVEMELIRARDDEYVLPGDDVIMQFSGLYHVAGKLAGVYNSNCHIKFGDVIVNDGVVLGTGQYDFAGNALAQQFPVKIDPASTASALVMDGGCLVPQGYGSGPGSHRAISYSIGIDPNFNAGIATGNFGSIPAQSIPVTPLAEAGHLKVSIELGSRAKPVDMEAIYNAFGDDAYWVSDDPTVARIGDDGEVFPVGGGETAIHVVKPGDDSHLLTCDVEVIGNDDFVAVTGVEFTHVGDKEIGMDFSWGNWGNYNNVMSVRTIPENATNKTVRITSANPDIVAVGKKGLSTYETTYSIPLFWNDATQASGESLITAESLDGGFKATTIVRWLKYSTKVTVNPTELDMELGDTFALTATLTPVDSDFPIEWRSEDESVATVDADGVVKAVGTGSTGILAVSRSRYGEVKSTCKVTVDCTSGIAEAAESIMRIWPNPCEGQLNISVTAADTMRVYDLSGNEVYSTSLTVGHNLVDLSSITKGFYIVAIGNHSERLVKK